MTVIPLPRPLSPHALAELREISREPVPYCAVNSGVSRKLTAEGFATVVDLPSPFKTHKGGNTAHLQITAAGLVRLRVAVLADTV